MRSVSDEQALITGCIKGNPESQRKLFEYYYPVLMNVCRRYTTNSDEAKDLLQDGFIKIFDNIKKFRGESSLKTWMTRIMINNAISQMQKEKRMLFSSLGDYDIGEDEYSDDMMPDTDANQVLLAIQQLPTGYRTIINLYGIEGYSHKQIGELLGISEGTSKSQLSRARKLLKQLLLNNPQHAKQGR